MNYALLTNEELRELLKKIKNSAYGLNYTIPKDLQSQVYRRFYAALGRDPEVQPHTMVSAQQGIDMLDAVDRIEGNS